jgi:GWxTD domain-containing protein
MRFAIGLILTGTLLFVFCGGSETAKICLYQQAELRANSPDFLFDALNFLSGGRNRTDVYVQIPYTSLRFSKIEEGLRAQFVSSITILTTKDSAVVSREYTETISAERYEETVGKGYKLSLKSFDLPPGRYRVSVKVVDQNSQRFARKWKAIRVMDYSRYKLSLSSIMLVNKVTEDKGVKTIVPNISSEIGSLGDKFSVFFEIYNSTGSDSLNLNSRMLGFNFTPSPFIEVGHSSRFITDSLRISRDSIVVKNDTIIQCFLNFDRPQRTHCDLVLRVNAMKKDQPAEGFVASSGISFVSRPLAFPYLLDLDQKIDPLVYIASDEEFKAIKSAKDTKEKAERFWQFWQKHSDMDEYYSRVEYANKYFTCNAEGWRTPMGAVYILLGPPVSVECYEPRTETWFYGYSEYRGISFRFTVGEESEGGNPCYRSLAGLSQDQLYALRNRWIK